MDNRHEQIQHRAIGALRWALTFVIYIGKICNTDSARHLRGLKADTRKSDDQEMKYYAVEFANSYKAAAAATEIFKDQRRNFDAKLNAGLTSTRE